MTRNKLYAVTFSSGLLVWVKANSQFEAVMRIMTASIKDDAFKIREINLESMQEPKGANAW